LSVPAANEQLDDVIRNEGRLNRNLHHEYLSTSLSPLIMFFTACCVR
jgi:hypothetical protein